MVWALGQPERVLPYALLVHAHHGGIPLDERTLQRVVHGLRDAEELLGAFDDLPRRGDAEVVHQANLTEEQLGDAAAEGRGAEVQDARTGEWGRDFEEPVHRFVTCDPSILVCAAGRYRDGGEHRGHRTNQLGGHRCRRPARRGPARPLCSNHAQRLPEAVGTRATGVT